VKSKKPSIFIVFMIVVLSSCAKQDLVKREMEYQSMEEPLEAVIALRKESIHSPNDVHVKSLLRQYELKAADYYYREGKDKFDSRNYSKAIELYEKGLAAIPTHDKLAQAVLSAKYHVEADSTYQEALKNYQAGKKNDAKAMLVSILNTVPDHKAAKELLSKWEADEGLVLKEGIDSNQKISLDFQGTDIKTAFGFLASAFEVNVVFDESVKDQSITLFAKDVSFKQALDLMLSTSKMFYKNIGGKTILISPDTKSKRDQYEEYIIKTFNLRTMPAAEMANLIKGVVKVNQLSINDGMNTIMIRDNEEILGLVEKIVELNDRRPAELLLEVEILEVNRNKAEQLGLDYGSVISASFPAVDEANNSIGAAISAGTVTLPSITFRYFKQDVEAKTLANPKIRVINKKEAKIHIGDRVPLRSSTIQNATGGTQTSYEYTDIGIRLDVEPIVHFDNSVSVKVNLEVSSLGQNLGTPEEPTYSIGTRNTQTYMLLRDGETAMIGGLIRDEDRNNKISVPGFGSIPVIGRLFSSVDDSTSRTDVLLTITPKVVRGWDMPSLALRKIYSGTADRYVNDSYLKEVKMEGEIQVGSNSKSEMTSIPNVNPSVDRGIIARVEFGDKLYQIDMGSEFKVDVNIDQPLGVSSMTIPVIYNKDIVEMKSVEAKTDGISNVENEYVDGGAVIHVDLVGGEVGSQQAFNIIFESVNAGISYLTLKSGIWEKEGGEKGGIASNASRIVVK